MHAGVPVTLNTDDLTVSDITLSEEYARAVERLGVTLPELWALDLAAIEAAFCDEATKDRAARVVPRLGRGHPGADSADDAGRPPRSPCWCSRSSATRLWEEGRWRAGKMSDRTTAILLVGRIAVPAGRLHADHRAGLAGRHRRALVGGLIAAALYPWMVGRLRRSTVKATGVKRRFRP